MDEFNELKRLQEFHVEILAFSRKGDVVLTIDSSDNDKTILSGKAATDLIKLVDGYLTNLYERSKESK